MVNKNVKLLLVSRGATSSIEYDMSLDIDNIFEPFVLFYPPLNSPFSSFSSIQMFSIVFLIHVYLDLLSFASTGDRSEASHVFLNGELDRWREGTGI